MSNLEDTGCVCGNCPHYCSRGGRGKFCLRTLYTIMFVNLVKKWRASKLKKPFEFPNGITLLKFCRLRALGTYVYSLSENTSLYTTNEYCILHFVSLTERAKYTFCLGMSANLEAYNDQFVTSIRF